MWTGNELKAGSAGRRAGDGYNLRMVNPRLELALERIGPTDWRYFEKFASEFLVDSFPGLRTTASVAGDKGRDAEIFDAPGRRDIKFQYSVAGDWKSKIKSTLKTISENFSDTKTLVYCTSQSIGAAGDGLSELAWDDFGIRLDVRDRSWFIERETTSVARMTAASELIGVFLTPLLQERNIIRGIATSMTAQESRVAFLQLALNEKDQRLDQSLTKTSFDSLVLAALNGTSSENPKVFDEVSNAVQLMLPSADRGQVSALVKSALDRLSKKGGAVKYLRSAGSYHISFTALNASQDRTAEFLLQQDSLERDLASVIYGLNEKLDEDPEALLLEAKTLRNALEHLLMHGGEAFAQSIIEGSTKNLAGANVQAELDSYEMTLTIHRSEAEAIIAEVISSPSDRGALYLERLLDAYTLFAFLQQTPDVQKTPSRIFDGGEVWLDTSVVLPLIAEMTHDEAEARPFTRLLRSTIDSGLSLYVTGGVIEEINHHLDNCLRFVRLGSEWRTRVPFVYSAYMLSGRSESQLGEWIAGLKGKHRPELDLEESLHEEFAISRKDLLELSDTADVRLRGAVQNLWLNSHSRRRSELSVGPGNLDRLVAHDVENVVGIIEHRNRSTSTAFGYSAWWLTLDRTALRLHDWLRDQLGNDAPHSPAISPDYFSQMLRFGPLRRNASTADAPALPMSLELGKFENIPPELLEIARETRSRYADYDERRIRREVRDALDRSRLATRAPRIGYPASDSDFVEDLE